MKKSKIAGRLTALMLSAAVSISALTGCGSEVPAGSETAAGAESGEAPITLTVFSQLANFSGPVGGWGGQLMLDKFNVILNIVPDTNGAIQTRMEQGDLGDIVVFGSDGANYTDSIRNGLLLDWNEDDILSDYGPYIKEHFAKALEKNAGIVPLDEDGNPLTEPGVVHGFGHNIGNSDRDGIDSILYTWDLRWDLYQQLGYPEVNELEDFIPLFEAMKEICPEDENGKPTYAFYLWPDWDGNMVMYVKSMASAYYGYDEFGIGLYDTETGAFYDCLDKNGPYVRCLRFLNKLYQKGLIDPDSMTSTYDIMTEKMKAGGVFCSIFNYAGSDVYNTEQHIQENKLMLSFNPKQGHPIVYGLSPLGGNRIWTIGAKTEYPELCMEIINYLATPEGAMTMWYGPRGVCWDYDTDGNTVFTALGKSANLDPKGTSMESAGYSGTYQDGIIQINNTTWSEKAINPDSNGEAFDSKLWKSEISDPVNEVEKAWREYSGSISEFDYISNHVDYRMSPGSTYSEGKRSDDLEIRWNEVTTNCIVPGSWNAIYASSDEEFESVLNNMIGQAKAHGYDECVKWCKSEAALRKAAEDALK
ncbi:MAG: extracellular solute-binding protein [Lachnospiraceae bacterium]|nr:extracellular solute-binding protein [Lachnospiraceae bacterium]